MLVNGIENMVNKNLPDEEVTLIEHNDSMGDFILVTFNHYSSADKVKELLKPFSEFSQFIYESRD